MAEDQLKPIKRMNSGTQIQWLIEMLHLKRIQSENITEIVILIEILWKKAKILLSQFRKNFLYGNFVFVLGLSMVNEMTEMGKLCDCVCVCVCAEIRFTNLFRL